MEGYHKEFYFFLLSFSLFCRINIIEGHPEGNNQLRPVYFESLEIEDEVDNKGLVDINTFTEPFTFIFGGEAMQDEVNRCQDRKRCTKYYEAKEKNEFIDSMKEDLDKWNNMIDSMSTGDYDVFSEMFGGEEGSEENKMEIV